MANTVADFIWQRLQEWGVRRVFGYPGDGIGGLIGALARTKGAIDFVQVRHEEMAGLMACAEAKFTGEVGVCIATSGLGVDVDEAIIERQSFRFSEPPHLRRRDGSYTNW